MNSGIPMVALGSWETPPANKMQSRTYGRSSMPWSRVSAPRWPPASISACESSQEATAGYIRKHCDEHRQRQSTERHRCVVEPGPGNGRTSPSRMRWSTIAGGVERSPSCSRAASPTDAGLAAVHEARQHDEFRCPDPQRIRLDQTARAASCRANYATPRSATRPADC